MKIGLHKLEPIEGMDSFRPLMLIFTYMEMISTPDGHYKIHLARQRVETRLNKF